MDIQWTWQVVSDFQVLTIDTEQYWMSAGDQNENYSCVCLFGNIILKAIQSIPII